MIPIGTIGYHEMSRSLISVLAAVSLFGLVMSQPTAAADQRAAVDAKSKGAVNATELSPRPSTAPETGSPRAVIRQVTRSFDFSRLTSATVVDWEEAAGE